MKKPLRKTNNSELISHILSYLETEDKLITLFNLKNSEKLKTLLFQIVK